MPAFRRFLLASLLLAATAAPVLADEPMEGQFTATSACPALVSIRKDTNPGAVETEPGTGYKLLARNRKKATHFRIEIPGATPPERWVEARCGKAAAAAPKATAPTSGASQASAKGKPEYVLAISWQPAFCEGSPRKPECRAQTNARFDASNFTLHGLWPQPGTNAYCGVAPRERLASSDSNWEDLPPLRLSLATQKALETAMPGSRSFLDRHEWTKHGSCYPDREPETYYRDSLRLLAAINASAVRELISSRVGRQVSAEDIRASFDEAFGAGAGERVRVACRDDGDRRLILELTIGLKGDIPGGASLPDLMLAAPRTEPGCPQGVVDPVGLQ
jgi:ribonuclease T2